MSKYKTHAARGTLTVGPSSQTQIVEPTNTIPPPLPPLPQQQRTHFVISQTLLGAIQALRTIKNDKLYLGEGAPSFRHWAIGLYGERFGIWLDEIL